MRTFIDLFMYTVGSLQGYWTRTAQQVSSCYAATCGHACQGTEGRSAGR